MKLVKFLMRLSQQKVTIEMKNGTIVTGNISGVDMAMNIHLRSVEMVNAKNYERSNLEYLTVRGHNLRYLLLDDNLNLDSLLIEDEVKKNKAVAGRGRGGRGAPGASRGRGRGGRGRGSGGPRGRGRGGPKHY